MSNYSEINNINGSWNVNNRVMNGVLPPSPSVIESSQFSYIEPNADKKYFKITINSREPYASEYLVTQYGSVQTRLGTMMGSR